MNESVLRVIQALQVQNDFEYVLLRSDIQYLEDGGYKVEILKNESFLYFCKITKGN